MARKSIRGIGKVRRILRALPNAMRGEIVVELNVTGRQILNAVLAKTPRRRGELATGMRMKVLIASLRLQVGLIGSKAEREGLFYGRIQDLGRKAQTVTVRRYLPGARARDTKRSSFEQGHFKLAALTTVYKLRVKKSEPKRFITGRQPELRKTLRANLQGIYGRAIAQVAGGGDE